MAEPSAAPPQQSEAIEAAEVHEFDEEHEFVTSDYDASSVSSSSASVASSVYAHQFENGRRYHQYRHGTYPIPNDDAEQNRDDMKHAMMMELTDGKLFYAPIGDNPQKIIDLGTGTGIWAIDVADKYPSAQVLGVDLSPIQPLWVPTNLKFIVDDIEDDWMHGDGWDLVHLRCISPWLKDQPKVLRMAYENLKPGAWIEIQEFDSRANCDDGSLPEDAPLKKFFDTASEAVKSFNMNFRAGESLRDVIKAAGFVNVDCVKLKVPIGTWPKVCIPPLSISVASPLQTPLTDDWCFRQQNPKLRLIGMYLRTAVNDMFGAMAAKPLRKVMDPAEIEVFLKSARDDLNNPNIHAYENYFFWTGQKPDAGTESKEAEAE